LILEKNARRFESSGHHTQPDKSNSPGLKAFYHPDYTVGLGISPDHALIALAGFTADRDLE